MYLHGVTTFLSPTSTIHICVYFPDFVYLIEWFSYLMTKHSASSIVPYLTVAVWDFGE